MLDMYKSKDSRVQGGLASPSPLHYKAENIFYWTCESTATHEFKEG